MTEPCSQKDNIEKLFEFHDTKMKELSDIKVKQAEIHGTVNHIAGRIDNGMSHTIASLNTLLTKLEPVIAHHENIISKIEDIGWWISKGLLFGIVGVIIWAIANGWKP